MFVTTSFVEESEVTKVKVDCTICSTVVVVEGGRVMEEEGRRGHGSCCVCVCVVVEYAGDNAAFFSLSLPRH